MARPRFGTSRGRRTTVKLVGVDLYLNDTTNIESLALRLSDMGARMSDVEPVLDLFGRYLVEKHIPSQFKRHGFPKRWAPLSDAYALWKSVHYPGKPLLVLTGAMRGGFDWQVSSKSLRITNRVRRGQKGGSEPRWIYHQLGTRKMPARPMVQIGQVDRERLRDLMRRHLEVAGGIT